MSDFTLQVEYRDPATLVPYEKNAKTHPEEQITKLMNSIREYVWDVPIVIDGLSRIIKGHGRQIAALRMHLSQVPVVVRIDLTEEQIRAARLADNRTAESPWDESLLGPELQWLRQQNYDLTMTGFDQIELDKLLKIGVDQPTGDEDAIPPEPVNPVTRPNDLWILGGRVVCPDCGESHEV